MSQPCQRPQQGFPGWGGRIALTLRLLAGDLRFDLGIGFAGTYQEPEYVESLNKIMTAAKTHGDKPVLTFAMGEQQVAMRFQQGFRLLMVGADCIDIARGMRQNLSMATETVKKLMNGDEKKEDGEPNGKA